MVFCPVNPLWNLYNNGKFYLLYISVLVFTVHYNTSIWFGEKKFKPEKIIIIDIFLLQVSAIDCEHLFVTAEDIKYFSGSMKRYQFLSVFRHFKINFPNKKYAPSKGGSN